MIGRTISCVYPRRTAQYVHWLWSWKWRGGPFPCVTHHVIKSCRNDQRPVFNILRVTELTRSSLDLREQITVTICSMVSLHFFRILFCPCMFQRHINISLLLQILLSLTKGATTITILGRKCCHRRNAMVSIIRTVFFWKWSLECIKRKKMSVYDFSHHISPGHSISRASIQENKLSGWYGCIFYRRLTCHRLLLLAWNLFPQG